MRKGLPRNDLLVRGADEAWVRAKKQELGLPTDRRLVLYCPTFRDRARRLGTSYELPLDLEPMRRELGEDVHLLLRPHYLDNYKLSPRYAPFATDVARHHDVTELMLLADVLVTDYSSVMFDFANTGKPMVFYTYDYEDYVRDERGTYFDLPDVAPGPMVATNDELVAGPALGRRRRRTLPRAIRRVPRPVLHLRDRPRGRGTWWTSSSPAGRRHDPGRAAAGRVPGGQQPRGAGRRPAGDSQPRPDAARAAVTG